MKRKYSFHYIDSTALFTTYDDCFGHMTTFLTVGSMVACTSVSHEFRKIFTHKLLQSNKTATFNNDVLLDAISSDNVDLLEFFKRIGILISMKSLVSISAAKGA